jgi:hypothetical protein
MAKKNPLTVWPAGEKLGVEMNQLMRCPSQPSATRDLVGPAA